MTVDEFRAAFDAARREDRLMKVLDDGEPGIAVGLDSSRGVALLHGGREAPLAGLVEWPF